MAGRKLGALGILLALVLVLGAAFVGHDALVREREKQAASAEASAAEDDVILLADHDATVYTELGEPLSLTDIADGKPLVVNFWATWCPYCVQEMPDFQDIYADYADRVSFAFVDVTDGRRETAEAACAWLADNGFDDLPAYYDTDLAASTSFGAYALPTTVVVSAEGEVLTITAGAIDSTLMRGALASLV